MLYVNTVLSLLFIVLGFVITENNAKYLLAGYNTMAAEDRENVDIKKYIQYLRSFHLFLGFSMFILGTILIQFISEVAGGIFIGVYPILGYIYFLFGSRKYLSKTNKNSTYGGFIILTITLIAIVGLLIRGMQENNIEYVGDRIAIDGMYGQTVPISEIESIELIKELPEITFKSNGYALGDIRKGYFKTKAGEKVKLILNEESESYILIRLKDSQKIYYATDDINNKEIVDEMMKTLPELIVQ